MTTLYLDTETTGLLPKYDEIVEIAIVDDSGAILLDTLVRPVRNTAWPGAQAIHGITPDDVRDALTLAELRPQIEALVQGQDVVIYNAAFDTGFLPHELTGATSIRCCMLAFAEHYGEWNDYYGNYRWHKLISAADHVRHQWEGSAHRALSDTLACRAVWRYLTDPSERARVEAIHADEKAQTAARYILMREANHEEWTWERYQERMTAFWLAWWLRTRELPPTWRISWEKEQKLADQYALTFTGYTNDVLWQVERAEALGLRRYEQLSDVPPYLKTKSGLQTAAIREGWRAPLAAYYVSAKRFNWLYDTRGNRLLKMLPEFKYGPIPEGYLTAPQLMKRYGLSAKQVRRKKVIGYWRQPYTHDWISLYAPPRSRARARTAT